MVFQEIVSILESLGTAEGIEEENLRLTEKIGPPLPVLTYQPLIPYH